MIFPDDDTGDVLRNMAADGDSLTRPRDIDFSVVFPDEASAKQFAERFRAEGYKAEYEFREVRPGFPWDVKVVKHMVPSHQAISEFEEELEDAAVALGGFNDGWGCFTLES